MIVNIAITELSIGNPSRGYHNYNATIQFQYGDDSSYVEWKEQKIVEAIVGDDWMWHSVKSTGEHVWKANYGYDSGD